MERNADFDPYVGIKLYSFLYDLDYQDIDVNLAPQHLIFGELKGTDAFNSNKKIEVSEKKLGYAFKEYKGRSEEFIEKFKHFFTDSRRFTYTPVISCKGLKALN